ncbi:MAG TPA: hypothetical protein VF618_10810 [Thermoanaerobaculia bacterium]
MAKQSHGHAGTIPLTPEQKMWLRANTVLPTIFAAPMVVIVGGALYLVGSRFGSHIAVKVFVALGVLLLLAVTAAVVLHVANNLRDAISGTARVAEALVVSKRESGRSPRSFYLECEALGTLIVMHEVYQAVGVGLAYRLVYSPHTKRCWTAEAIA